VLVSRLVANVQRQSLKASDITAEMIDEIAVELNQRPLQLSQETVKRALDPVENVNIRARTGGPAPVEVERMLKKRYEQQDELGLQLQNRLDNLKIANQGLAVAVENITL
jgi:argininosuccinate lyase